MSRQVTGKSNLKSIKSFVCAKNAAKKVAEAFGITLASATDREIVFTSGSGHRFYGRMVLRVQANSWSYDEDHRHLWSRIRQSFEQHYTAEVLMEGLQLFGMSVTQAKQGESIMVQGVSFQ